MKYKITHGKRTWGAFKDRRTAEKIAARFNEKYGGGYYIAEQIDEADLQELESRITEAEKSGDLKRRTFLAATHNRYSKALGIAPRFTW